MSIKNKIHRNLWAYRFPYRKNIKNLGVNRFQKQSDTNPAPNMNISGQNHTFGPCIGGEHDVL